MKHSVGRLRAYGAACGGLEYTKNLLAHHRSSIDTLAQCGIKLAANKNSEAYFKGVKIGDDAHADVVYRLSDEGFLEKSQMVYGPMDEERRVNINALNGESFRILSVLLQQVAEVKDALTADDIAASVVNWRLGDSAGVVNAQGQPIGAMSNYYASLKVPYKIKNEPFACPEELLMIKGITPTIFKKIKPYITVYPQKSPDVLKINVLTAPMPVLKALFLGVGQGANAQDYMDAVIKHRKLPEGQGSDAAYAAALQAVPGIATEKSSVYRIHAVGVDEVSGIKSVVEDIVSVDDTGTATMLSRRQE